MSDNVEVKAKRGFATMEPEAQRVIAALGGGAVKKENRSFSTDRDLAKEAGHKGGSSVDPENRTFSRNATLASEAGRKGGLAVQAKRRAKLLTEQSQ